VVPGAKLFATGVTLFGNTVTLFFNAAKKSADGGLAASVDMAARDDFVATRGCFPSPRDGFAPTCVGDVKTVGGEATAGPSSALSQSDAASAGTPTGVTGRRL
jgi:hypothetical protein